MPKHIPLRSCVACREAKPKRELVRVVRVSDDRVEVDLTGKHNGRGAYFCPALECWELGQKKRALNHALSMTVSGENWERLFSYARTALPEQKVPTRVSAAEARTRMRARK
ncbi:MAG TPA: YlxR family protein [Chloroflexota bacterium]|nr:YlxR family protein [Chloroflexota bacterium]